MRSETLVVLDTELLDARIVARLLSLKVSTVYAAVKTGKLPYIVLWAGKKRPLIRFRRSDIEAFVRDRTFEPIKKS